MGSPSKASEGISSILLGSAFLMATSAIGPGFITQTTVFTERLGTSFGFIILCSMILDIVVQLNIWRVVSVSGLRAQDLANRVYPGMGYLLAFLIVAGGLAFNIGNLAGAGLGVQVTMGLDVWKGVVFSAIISLLIFWNREAGKALDIFTKLLGIVMIVLTGYVAVISGPPVGKAIQHSFLPEIIDSTAIIVLVGGTVGGYISFAGAHRLLDGGITGREHILKVTANSVRAIVLATVMRVLLFLAALGVVWSGVALDPANPPASVFQVAAGEIGYRIFGIVLWCASITSVVGSAYTSVSFLRTLHPRFQVHHRLIITVFVLFSAVIFLVVGRPVAVLVLVGAINGFILPFSLGIILLAARQSRIMGDYRHPMWMQVSGWIVIAVLIMVSIRMLTGDSDFF